MHLARALLEGVELVVLDEPEAGLDQDARAWLKNFLSDLCTQRRVVAIVHDARVLPEGLTTIECRREGPSRVAPVVRPRDTRIA
jgi:ATPase subunit of ABC transporter with duplicated ATPase domains